MTAEDEAAGEAGPCARCRDYEREPGDYVEDAIEAEGKVAELTKELAERDASFELRWSADMRAIARWREESPVERDLFWPDHADMVVWLLGQLTAKDELIKAALAYAICLRKRLHETGAYKQASAECLYCGHEHQETIDKLRADVAMQDQVREVREAEEAEETDEAKAAAIRAAFEAWAGTEPSEWTMYGKTFEAGWEAARKKG